MRTFEGKFDGRDVRIAIVAGRFNEFITSKLVGGALDVLKRNDVSEENTQKYDAIITLGAVIKGSTPHFDYVCAEVSKGVSQISLQSELPVIFGVLTTNNIEEAIERAGTKAGNKGADAAFSAIEMINLIKEIG